MADIVKMTLRQRQRFVRGLVRPGEPELLEQIRLARDAMDGEAGGRLAFIVRFAREDPKRWLPGESETHSVRLLAAVHQLPPNLVGASGIRPLTRREVLALHADTRRLLVEVVTRPLGSIESMAIEVPAAGLRTYLLRVSKPGVKPAVFTTMRQAPFRTRLLQEIASLVAASDRLIACPGPGCGLPFLALRKMKFCSAKCAERWHNARKIDRYRKGGPRDAR